MNENFKLILERELQTDPRKCMATNSTLRSNMNENFKLILDGAKNASLAILSEAIDTNNIDDFDRHVEFLQWMMKIIKEESGIRDRLDAAGDKK